MKNYLLFLLMTFLFISCQNLLGPESWSDVSDGIRFRIWTDKSTYQVGEDVWLYIEFMNVSFESKVIFVGPKQDQLPEEAPLYDIEIVITQLKIYNTCTNFKINPVLSNMWSSVPDLLKLQPWQKYQEKTKLNSGRWRHRREPFTDLESGKYGIQTIYSWDELPYPTPERIEQLERLGASLWTGYLESNKVTVNILN